MVWLFAFRGRPRKGLFRWFTDLGRPREAAPQERERFVFASAARSRAAAGAQQTTVLNSSGRRRARTSNGRLIAPAARRRRRTSDGELCASWACAPARAGRTTKNDDSGALPPAGGRHNWLNNAFGAAPRRPQEKEVGTVLRPRLCRGAKTDTSELSPPAGGEERRIIYNGLGPPPAGGRPGIY